MLSPRTLATPIVITATGLLPLLILPQAKAVVVANTVKLYPSTTFTDYTPVTRPTCGTFCTRPICLCPAGFTQANLTPIGCDCPSCFCMRTGSTTFTTPAYTVTVPTLTTTSTSPTSTSVVPTLTTKPTSTTMPVGGCGPVACLHTVCGPCPQGSFPTSSIPPYPCACPVCGCQYGAPTPTFRPGW